MAVLVLAAMAAPCLAETEEPEGNLLKDLEKYIGRELVKENRAAQADVTWLLPQTCPPFYLRDEDGNAINPHVDPDVAVPVSVEQTCMKCKEVHDPRVVMKGYHFQMGYDEMYPNTQADETDPVSKGPGFYGKWSLLYHRQIAPKGFADPNAIDLTPFEWVTECGVCHPGGGPGKFDRIGRRYDQILGQEPLKAKYEFDGDYYGSEWDKTGVLEADCFICHLKGYEYSSRAKQIKKGNFKWAATQASGVGVVNGSVNDKEVPQVTYFDSLFDPDGKVHLEIQRPDDRACMFCHTMSSVKKRGTAWHTQFAQDTHSQTGMKCIDCHTSDIRHNFAKGASSSMTARDDLDDTMLSCKGCHYDTKAFGAPDYKHPGIPPLHLERMSCQACHITKRPFLSSRVVDTLTGKVIELPNDPDYSGPAENRMFGALWGTASLSAAALLDPLPREILEQAAATTIGADHPFRESFANLDGSLRLPEGAFTVKDFMATGGDLPLADTADKRKLMIMALEEIAPPSGDRIVACIFRGEAMQVRTDRLIPIDTNMKPRRAGNIAEHPVSVMQHTVDGKEALYPVGYQVSTFWAFEDRGVLRPLFVDDMKRAWDFLESHKAPPEKGEEGQEEFALRYYPIDPPGREIITLPEPGAEGFIGALKARLAQYGDEDWRTVTVYDDNNDKWPEVNTESEMATVAWAITRTMDRLEQPALYFVKGLNAYKVTVGEWLDPYTVSRKDTLAPGSEPFMAVVRLQWNEEAKKWSTKDIRLTKPISATVEPVDMAANPEVAALAQRLPWTISHGVEPVEQALGAQGCADCHSADSPFFFGTVLVDPFDEQGEPVTVSQASVLGYHGRPRKYTGPAGLVNAFFNFFTVIVIGGLIGHMCMDALARMRSRKKEKATAGGSEMVQRFNGHFLTQHFLLMASVMLLIISAIPLYALRFTGAHWAGVMTSALGGVDLWRVVHRFAAGGLVFVCIYHVVYSLANREGRRDFMLMMPRPKDFGDLGHNLQWFFGMRKTPPRFGRFSYVEKFDYWAVFWGCVIMVGTGLAMWFPDVVRAVVPDPSLAFWDTVKEAHAHEAILAALAIIIWHFYNVHYRPGKFPGSLTWLHGRITRHEMEEEHPAELEGMASEKTD
jgi:cytochrome b subunit of formate dehydrogenase